jgi:hypothetical protein
LKLEVPVPLRESKHLDAASGYQPQIIEMAEERRILGCDAPHDCALPEGKADEWGDLLSRHAAIGGWDGVAMWVALWEAKCFVNPGRESV